MAETFSDKVARLRQETAQTTLTDDPIQIRTDLPNLFPQNRFDNTIGKGHKLFSLIGAILKTAILLLVTIMLFLGVVALFRAVFPTP